MDLVAEAKIQDSNEHALAIDGQAESSGTMTLFHSLSLSSGMTSPSISHLHLGCL